MDMKYITNNIDSIPTHNYFKFKDESYIQSHGTSMGTKKAPYMLSYLCGMVARFTGHILRIPEGTPSRQALQIA